MKQVLAITLAALAVSAASTPLAPPSGDRVTTKGVQPFAQCFTAAQDRAGRAWSFVPKENGGGTFSNAGANGVSRPYFLDVADRGSMRVVRLSSAGADRSILLAVDHCV
jgi:hypothetical protein